MSAGMYVSHVDRASKAVVKQLCCASVQVGSKKDHKEEPASNVPRALMTEGQLAKKRDELLVGLPGVL